MTAGSGERPRVWVVAHGAGWHDGSGNAEPAVHRVGGPAGALRRGRRHICSSVSGLDRRLLHAARSVTRPPSARLTLVACCLAIALVASVHAAPAVLRLATTTSTEDSGLLAAILPAFEKQCGCRVDVIAVGTGQALEIARRGDADVVLVHARSAEDQFVKQRHARDRRDVMYNDFVIVGPAADPAKIGSMTSARDAFAAMARARAPFVSRGDRSGTETVEKNIWAAAKISPAGAPWYRSVGQGMGETLVTANEQDAYTLADRGTWLAMKPKLPRLRLLVGGRTLAANPDPGLRNPYGVMAVNPDVHPGVNFALAQRFVDWIVSAGAQRAIGEFGRQKYGEPLFYPNAAAR